MTKTYPMPAPLEPTDQQEKEDTRHTVAAINRPENSSSITREKGQGLPWWSRSGQDSALPMQGPGSIPALGTRSHVPQLRVLMPQLKIPHKDLVQPNKQINIFVKKRKILNKYI